MPAPSTTSVEPEPPAAIPAGKSLSSKAVPVPGTATDDPPPSRPPAGSRLPEPNRSREPSRFLPDDIDSEDDPESPIFPRDDTVGFISFSPSFRDREEPEDEPPRTDPDAPPSDVDNDGRISFMKDLKHLPSMLWHDNLSLYTWRNAIILGAATGGTLAIRNNLDPRVRSYTAEHPERWGKASVVLRHFGEYTTHMPVLVGTYALSLFSDNDKLHEFSLAAISAYSLSAMYTVAIKGVTDTSRPTTEFQDGRYGFPSYHASSTFSFAAVIDEYYGWEVGVPAYVTAGIVSWTRIDQREHDLSDVFFGAVLGVVIGKSVSAAHLQAHPDFRVGPYVDPETKATGVSIEAKF